MSRAGPKRTKAQREEDLVFTARAYLRGKAQHAIAEELSQERDYKITQQQISVDLKTIFKRWRDSQISDMDELKRRELEKIDHVETTYWEQWERSVTADEYDRGFLQGVHWCVEQRCKILGLLAPSRIAPTTPDGDKPYVLTETERAERLLEVLEKIKERIGEA